MRSIQGNLSLMPLMDIIQWADSSKRSGTLTLTRDTNQKKFYFQDGQIIFVWSDRVSESIADFLRTENRISSRELNEALADAKSLGLSIIGYLYSHEIIGKEPLEKLLRQVAETALTAAMKWESGLFDFSDELPNFVLNGPIKLNSTQLLLESVKNFDESGTGNSFNTNRIIGDITARIAQRNLELPPIPDIMQQLTEKIEKPLITIDEIAQCITDQILASKILKICNSPYYWRTRTISTLKDAIVFIGVKSLKSIVTVHALSSFSPRNSDKIRKILHHCLVCGMLARQIAGRLNKNSEQAFMCGLLHDIGKTAMHDLLSDYIITEDTRAQLIAGHHAEIGFLLAEKWCYGEDIKESIRFHHDPAQLLDHPDIVEIVHLADIIANNSRSTDELLEMHFATFDIRRIAIPALFEQLDLLNQDADGIVNPT